MDIKNYFEKINSDSQKIFLKTIENKSKIGSLHHASANIYEFCDIFADPDEKKILEIVCAQLDSATYTLTIGLYRQAFASLRLAFEMALAAIHFSTNKLELIEWINNKQDIKWSKLIDEDNGVLSKRFARAFFDKLENHIEDYRKTAITTYRYLSEYVHGNNDTWENSGIKLTFNENIIQKYIEYFKNSTDVILFLLICRYSSSINSNNRESIQFTAENFNHIHPIRNLFE